MSINSKKIRDSLVLLGLANDPSSPQNGEMYYNTTSNKFRKYENGSWSDLGSGDSVGKNYINNPNAESNTNGYNLYDDGAVARPIDGTGGSPAQLTFTRVTSTPLRGIGSFNLAKAAADAQGEGVSIDFTIDEADKAKMLLISFDYEIASGTFNGGSSSTDSDLIAYIYRTTATGRVIEPTPFKISGAVVGQKYKFQGWFQTDSDATGYRLIFHVATTSASAWTFKFDNVVVGPQTASLGAPVTDWQSYPLTIGASGSAPTKGTTSKDVAEWRRVGDSMEIRYDFVQTGAGSAGSGTYLFPLPSGYSIDSDKQFIDNGSLNSPAVGGGQANAGSAGSQGPVTVTAYNSNNLSLLAHLDSATPTPIGSSHDALSNASVVYSFYASVPIQGWASTLVLSQDTDSRTVLGIISGTPASSLSASDASIVYPTVDKDTHGFYSGGGVFTIPVAGNYRLAASYSVDGTEALDNYVQIKVRKNSTIIRTKQINIVAGLSQTQASLECTLWDLKAGDVIDVVSNTSISSPSYNGGAAVNYFEIERIAGPETIAPSEQVRARYTTTAGASLTSATQIEFDTKDFDTHGTVSLSPWKFTAPRAGFVDLHMFGIISSASTQAIQVYKNGVAGQYIALTQSNIGGSAGVLEGTAMISVVAGDVIDLRPTDTAGTFVTTAGQVYIEIKMD